MNGDSNHNHVNGQAHRTEEEEAQLDAYQEELTHEAILDEVKVQTTPTFPLILDLFRSPRNSSFTVSRI